MGFREGLCRGHIWHIGVLKGYLGFRVRDLMHRASGPVEGLWFTVLRT